MMKRVTTPSVHFSSTVTIRVFEGNAPTLRSHICPVGGTCSPPRKLTQADAASESEARAKTDVSEVRRVQQRISIAAVRSFQHHLRTHASDPATHPGLLCCVSSKFSQRARDLASEYARQLFCEVYQPAEGTAVTIPLRISKFPAIKRKSDAARYDTEANWQSEQKRRCVSMP